MSKENLLKERGWYQWYNPNYWCHEQFSAPGVDPTNRGMSTDEAYLFETNEESRKKTLAGMALYHGAVNALSNMWYRSKRP